MGVSQPYQRKIPLFYLCVLFFFLTVVSPSIGIEFGLNFNIFRTNASLLNCLLKFGTNFSFLLSLFFPSPLPLSPSPSLSLSLSLSLPAVAMLIGSSILHARFVVDRLSTCRKMKRFRALRVRLHEFGWKIRIRSEKKERKRRFKAFQD